MSIKVRISKPGKDVWDGDEHQVYDSDWDSLKASEIDTATLTLTTGQTSGETTIAHGLAYTPAFFCLVQLSSGVWSPLPFSNLFTDLASRVAVVSARANATNLILRVTGVAAGATVNLSVKYYIFYNQLDS